MTSHPSPQSRDDERAVNLGLRLRVARQKSGLSLRELARRLGVSASFLSQIENGKSQPSVATLYSIAQMLEVSIDHLFSPDDTAADEAAVAVVNESDDEPVPDIPTVLGAMKRQREEAAAETPYAGRTSGRWKASGRRAEAPPGSR